MLRLLVGLFLSVNVDGFLHAQADSNNSGHGDSSGFPLNTVDEAETGLGESNAFILDTGGDDGKPKSGHADSAGFSLDTRAGGDTGSTIDLEETGASDSGAFALDTSNGNATPPDITSGFADSGGFTLDTYDPIPFQDSGFGDSGGFVLDTGGDDGTVKSGIADSGGFILDTRSTTGDDNNQSEFGFSDSNSFVLDTQDDDNGTNPGDHNGTFEYAVYDLNTTHIYDLTWSGSAPAGTYVILEKLDDSNNTYLIAEPVIMVNGVWEVDQNKTPYPLESSLYYNMAEFENYAEAMNLHPLNIEPGFPIFDLNASQVGALTWGGVSTAGYYAVVDMNETFADLEPVIQDGNGTWVVTASDDYFNLVPSIYYNLDALKAWLDANASAPVAFLPFDDNHTDGNHSGPGDYNGTNPGDHNGTFEYAVYDLNTTHIYDLTWSGSAPAGTYVILEKLDDSNNTYLIAEPVIMVNGVWEVDQNKTPYPLESSLYYNMAEFENYAEAMNLHPLNIEPGFPIFDLNASQVGALTWGGVSTAGYYAA